MIERYCTPVMRGIWNDEAKFWSWFRIELGVLEAKAEMGMIPASVPARISQQATFTVARIEEIEREIGHDLQAFVDAVREGLESDLRKYFHEGLTSFDTEEPALSLTFVASGVPVFQEIDLVLEILKGKALQYKHFPMIGRTHGQHAEPITLGLKFLWWYDTLERTKRPLESALEAMRETKINGAVGSYGGGLNPQLEKAALARLGLTPARVTGQIILRDRHARVMNELAVLAAGIENIALNIRLHGQTEIRELQEPFGRSQKGSSRMPHKKNTVLTENLCGLARIVRANVSIALENISTWDERDISHSSAERVIFADSFNVVHFMLRRLKRVLEGLVVNEERITENLNLTRGTIFSGEVKDVLMEHGLDPETAYRIAQNLAFEAVQNGTDYLDLLLASGEVPDSVKQGRLQTCFDIARRLSEVDGIFKRFDQ